MVYKAYQSDAEQEDFIEMYEKVIPKMHVVQEDLDNFFIPTFQ